MPKTYEVQFGYLPVADTVSFSGGEILSLPEFDTIVADVAKFTHPDGHVYPPASHDITMKPHWKKWRKIPQTERAAHLHKLPSTHTIKINRTFPDEQAARYGDAGFIMHFLGFIFGFRCQFHDSIAGCASDEVARAVETRLTSVEALARDVVRGGLLDVMRHDPDVAREHMTDAAPALVLWNPAARSRGGVVVADITLFRRDVPVGPPTGAVRGAHPPPEHESRTFGLAGPDETIQVVSTDAPEDFRIAPVDFGGVLARQPAHLAVARGLE